MSASYSASATTILFSDGGGIDLRRRAATAAIERRLGSRFSLQFAAGASIDGDIVDSGVRHELRPGPLAVVGAGYRILDGRGMAPFILAGLSLGFSTTATDPLFPGAGDPARLTAVDFRGSLVLGKLLLDHLAPYAALRGYGGPVFWQHDGGSVVGTDQYHVTLGAGALVTAAAAPRGAAGGAHGWSIDGFFEVMPLGERSATFGLAVAL